MTLLVSSPALHANEQGNESSRLSKVKQKIQNLQSLLTGKRGQYSKMQTELQDTEKRIYALQKTVVAREQERDQLEKELGALRQEQEEASANQQAQQEALNKQLEAIYIQQQQPALKLLLQAEDAAKLGRALAYYQYLYTAQVSELKALSESLERLENLETEIQTKQVALEQVIDDQRKEQDSLKKNQKEREQLLAKLTGEISNQEGQLKQLVTDEKALQKIIDDLARAEKQRQQQQQRQKQKPVESRPLSEKRGQHPWPVDGKVLHAFNSQRIGKQRWQGVVISAPEGAPVKAVSPGKVVFADWLRGFGLLIIVEHGNNYMSLYGHNSALTKVTGDRVQAGEVIASVGQTGGQPVSSLYFEIRKGGKPINPGNYLLSKR